MCAGHAGSRIGWAIVGNPVVAQTMRTWIAYNGQIAVESQARAAGLLEHVIGTHGELMLINSADCTWQGPNRSQRGRVACTLENRSQGLMFRVSWA